MKERTSAFTSHSGTFLELPGELAAERTVRGEQAIASFFHDMPLRAGVLLYHHLLATQGEGDIHAQVAQWDRSLLEHQITNPIRHMIMHATGNTYFEWKGGGIPAFNHLFPRNVTGKGTFTEVVFGAPEIQLHENPQNTIALLSSETRGRLQNGKYIFSPGAVLVYTFRVLDWKRKAAGDSPLSGMMVHPFVATVGRVASRLEEDIWGGHRQVWTHESMERITNNQRQKELNMLMAEELKRYHIAHPYEGGAFGQNS